MEMLQVCIGYPQIHTDMVFENVSTLPLEQCAGSECNVDHNNIHIEPNDGDEVFPLRYKVRQNKEFPIWRQHCDEELLILQGLVNSPISVDKITKFSVRLPELRHIIQKTGDY